MLFYLLLFWLLLGQINSFINFNALRKINHVNSKKLFLNENNLTGNENQESFIKNSNQNNFFNHYGTEPRLDDSNSCGELTWYPIGFSQDFSLKPKRITIRDINYIIWKEKNKYYALRDCCSHQGSSFLFGKTNKNTITCPYHGYVFDGSNGNLIDIPQLDCVNSKIHNVESYKIVEKGDMIYLNTIPLSSINNLDGNQIDENKIFIEPEFFDKDQRVVYLSENFEHYAKFVSVNSLDICHIGFVHTFGNKKSPNPINFSEIIKINDTNHHYKIIYQYLAGENSLVNKIYNFDKIIVENEYILPHTTVARVIFGPYTSTIITHALPISKFKTKLFVKAYRSYWSFDLNSKTNNLLFPLYLLVNKIGDTITKKTMYTTLKQDKLIVDFIDKTNYNSMHGKFSIIFDKFSNHYKNHYKKYYEHNNTII